MKCKHCNSQWKTTEELGSKLSTCPFCGKELNEEPAQTEKPTSVEEVLKQIVRQHGTEVMKKGNQMLAFYMDMAPVELRKDKILLEYLVQSKGHLALLKLQEVPEDQRQPKYEQVVSKMCSDLYVSEAAARKACDAFYCAVYGKSVDAQAEKNTQTEQASSPQEKKAPEKAKKETKKEPEAKPDLDIYAPLLLTEKEAKDGCNKRVTVPEGKSGLSVKVPANVENGSTLRLKGCGKTDPATGKQGDVYLKVCVTPQPEKKKTASKLNVKITMDLTPEEAQNGCVKKYSSKDVEEVAVQIQAGARDGQVLRIRGAGRRDPDTGNKGMLTITLKVDGQKAQTTGKEEPSGPKASGYTFRITTNEANLGAKLPLNSNQSMKLVVPKNTKNGDQVTVTHKGNTYTAKVKIVDAVYASKPAVAWSEMPESFLQLYVKNPGTSKGVAAVRFLLIFIVSTFLGLSPIGPLAFVGWIFAFMSLHSASRSRTVHAEATQEFERRKSAEKNAFKK